jgi:hypothetical protein
MKSDTRDHGDIRIIELGGKITIGSGDVKIRELVSQAIDDDKKNILFDLKTWRSAQADAPFAQDQRHPAGHPVDHGLRCL